MKNFRSDELKSEVLRRMAEYLLAEGFQVTFFGEAWGNASGNWVYFNCVLDLDRLRADFSEGKALKVHENRDPRSGTERGFIDPETGEALMGLLPG